MLIERLEGLNPVKLRKIWISFGNNRIWGRFQTWWQMFFVLGHSSLIPRRVQQYWGRQRTMPRYIRGIFTTCITTHPSIALSDDCLNISFLANERIWILIYIVKWLNWFRDILRPNNKFNILYYLSTRGTSDLCQRLWDVYRSLPGIPFDYGRFGVNYFLW